MILKMIVLKLIVLYQRFISPLLAPRCRFYPSCSQYCFDAVEQHGIIKGLFLGIKGSYAVILSMREDMITPPQQKVRQIN